MGANWEYRLRSSGHSLSDLKNNSYTALGQLCTLTSLFRTKKKIQDLQKCQFLLLWLCMTKSSLAPSENEVSVDPQAWPVQPLSSPEASSAARMLSDSAGYGGVDVLSNPLSLQTWHRLLRYWGLAWNRIAKKRNTILRISRLFSCNDFCRRRLRLQSYKNVCHVPSASLICLYMSQPAVTRSVIQNKSAWWTCI